MSARDPVQVLQEAMGEPFGALPSEGLGQRLAQLLQTARQACPSSSLEDEAYLEHAGRKLAASSDPAAALEGLHGPDLFLACAAARGDGPALSAFEALVAGLDRTLARIGLAPAAIEESKQRLRDHLLVGGAGGPAILSYSGRGPLRAWIKVAAVRIGIKLARSEQRELAVGGESALEEGALALEDPELRYLKEHYRDAFREALHQAIGGLESRELNLIRLHYLDGLTTTQIGALYRVHQATASRWLERARAAILTGTRRALMDQLRLDRSEYESIMRLIGSRLDMTLRSFFLE